MSTSERNDAPATVRRRSGWLLPLAVLLTVFALSVAFLAFYLVPAPSPLSAEQVSPTSRTSAVIASVNKLQLAIPANYFEFGSQRKAGPLPQIALFAILPEMAGWSNWDADSFAAEAARSPIVHILIRAERDNLSEAEKLERIYLFYVANPKGEAAPGGLTRYFFTDASGYRHEDLFVGHDAQGPVVMRCVRVSPDVPSPNCLRDMRIATGVSVSYRFKRTRLDQWRTIAVGVEKLIAEFRRRAAGRHH